MMCRRLKYILSNISVEPIILLTIFPSMVYQLATQNLILEKACRVELQLNTSTCDALTIRNASGYTPLEEADVQKLTSKMIAIKTAIKGVFPLFLSPFVGSWSDRHNKRKPVILSPVIGEFLCCIFLIVNVVFFYQLPIILTAIADTLPMSLLGGWPCLFLGIYSYIGSISNQENKTMRIGFVSTMQSFSMLLGIGASGILTELLGFLPTYCLCSVLIFGGIMFGCFFVKDVVPSADDIEKDPVMKSTVSIWDSICDFFDFRYLCNTLRVCFKSRRNNRRYRMAALMILAVVGAGPVQGENTVTYLYTRYKFGWNAVYFSIFMVVHFIGHVVASLFALTILSKYMKWEDATLGMLSMLSSLLGSLLCALAPNDGSFYAGGILDCFFHTSIFATRSLLAKTVLANEQGQANSIFGLFEATTPLVFGPLYTFLYENTITIFPGSFYFLSATIKAIGFGIYAFMYMETIKDKRNIAVNNG